jgi:hypothetical protein
MNRIHARLKDAGCKQQTILCAGLLLFAVHALSFFLVKPAYRSDVIAGFGGAVICLGIWLAALPYLRKGLDKAVKEAMPKHPGMFSLSAETSAKASKNIEAAGPGVRRDILDERVRGVLVIAAGTLINGYAGFWARIVQRIFSLPLS